MKELADGTLVKARIYRYLLEFNASTDWEYMRNELQKENLTLDRLNKSEFTQLFEHAITLDLERLCTIF